MVNLKNWSLIYAAVSAHAVACILTWYALTYTPARECNGAMLSLITRIGHFPIMVITCAIILIIMWDSARTFEQKEGNKDKVCWVLMILVIICVVDAMNDLLAVTHNPYRVYTAWVLTTALFPVNYVLSLFGLGGQCG